MTRILCQPSTVLSGSGSEIAQGGGRAGSREKVNGINEKRLSSAAARLFVSGSRREEEC